MNAVCGLETDDPVFQCKKGEITALSDKLACGKYVTFLTDQNTAGRHELAAETFDATALGIGVAAIFRTAAAFFCCHNLLSLNELRFMNRCDLDL